MNLEWFVFIVNGLRKGSVSILGPFGAFWTVLGYGSVDQKATVKHEWCV